MLQYAGGLADESVECRTPQGASHQVDLTPSTQVLGSCVYFWFWKECRHKCATGRILMGGKGNCPFLSALLGTDEMSAGARSGYGARLGFWDSGMAFGEE